ncbi:hypothetical protein GCWU000324_01295 [Kingella oralis ATCC 51147]|uniref:Uncharacterized protein n=1 Tax=Kingella oralis ATCC 51147 TaxID=629741 RepID=C4GGM7_9NEIS|nr:hypothetical protein GCWU000324_01295 [Kingella oralis ATCC 51147]
MVDGLAVYIGRGRGFSRQAEPLFSGCRGGVGRNCLYKLSKSS